MMMMTMIFSMNAAMHVPMILGVVTMAGVLMWMGMGMGMLMVMSVVMVVRG